MSPLGIWQATSILDMMYSPCSLKVTIQNSM